jgi:hypothetical protein
MGMNPDTGEILQFPTPEQIPPDWTPLDARTAGRLLRLPPDQRPAALVKWRARRARLHARALTRK